MFSPRYKRDKSPSNAGHGVKQSVEVDELSNHAFGSALDVNADDNPFGKQPAPCPMRVACASSWRQRARFGFFWGGYFSNPKDGMHFEFTDFELVVA